LIPPLRKPSQPPVFVRSRLAVGFPAAAFVFVWIVDDEVEGACSDLQEKPPRFIKAVVRL
jgi:hypothetical protein